jgi:E3 ubiquitin-protein ligase NEDD4
MQINASSGVANGDHLRYFRFIGRVLGKALFDSQIIPSHMIRHLYKHILGWPLMFDDIEMIDTSVHRSLQQVLEYAKGGADVEDLCLDFTVTEEMLGESKVIPLVEGGEDMDVTNDNLKLFMESRLKYQVLDR